MADQLKYCRVHLKNLFFFFCFSLLLYNFYSIFKTTIWFKDINHILCVCLCEYESEREWQCVWVFFAAKYEHPLVIASIWHTFASFYTHSYKCMYLLHAHTTSDTVFEQKGRTYYIHFDVSLNILKTKPEEETQLNEFYFHMYWLKIQLNSSAYTFLLSS